MNVSVATETAMARFSRPEFADGIAFIDGEFVPVAEAKIPLLDWGFIRSDVTYDVVHVWRGRFFRLQHHLARFERSPRRKSPSIPPPNRPASSHHVSSALFRRSMASATPVPSAPQATIEMRSTPIDSRSPADGRKYRL